MDIHSIYLEWRRVFGHVNVLEGKTVVFDVFFCIEMKKDIEKTRGIPVEQHLRDNRDV